MSAELYTLTNLDDAYNQSISFPCHVVGLKNRIACSPDENSFCELATRT
jgi:hypothetical protein